LRIIQTLGAEVARGEDQVLRAGRLILEEQRTRLSAGLSTVDAQNRFKGGEDNIPLPPPDTLPEERENMRIMFSMLADALDGKAVARRGRLVDGAVVPTPPIVPAPPQAPRLRAETMDL
jgi:hypothetical protein